MSRFYYHLHTAKGFDVQRLSQGKSFGNIQLSIESRIGDEKLKVEQIESTRGIGGTRYMEGRYIYKQSVFLSVSRCVSIYADKFEIMQAGDSLYNMFYYF